MPTNKQPNPNERRTPPQGMPSQVPPRKPPRKPPHRQEPVGDHLPVQKPVTDEPELIAPAKWKGIVIKVLKGIGLAIVLALVYVFLLMGEPSEDDQLTAQNAVQEEIIRVPMAAAEVAGNADLTALGANFGKPVLALNGSALPMQKATLYDTAFGGGYARRLTLRYAFADGSILQVESLRPTTAVSLLGKGFRLGVGQLYTLSGMDAVRMESDTQVCILARSLDVAYAILCPIEHAAELPALMKQAALMQATAP